MPIIYSSQKTSIKFIKRNYLWLLGVLIIFSTLFYQNIHKKRILSFSKPVPRQELKTSYKPVRIIIPSLGIDLEVSEGSIENGVWQISDKGASHLDISANPGDGGNVVIYGHNKNNLFGPIRWIKFGDEIKVVNSNNVEFIYKVSKTLVVSPNEVEYVYPKNEETLTLYTCTGFMDSKRFIVIAFPKGV